MPGDRVLVTVVENPTIGIVAFEGNKKIKDDDLKKKCSRSPVARWRGPSCKANFRAYPIVSAAIST